MSEPNNQQKGYIEVKLMQLIQQAQCVLALVRETYGAAELCPVTIRVNGVPQPGAAVVVGSDLVNGEAVTAGDDGVLMIPVGTPAVNIDGLWVQQGLTPAITDADPKDCELTPST